MLNIFLIHGKNFEGNLVIYHEKKIPKSFISSIKKIKKEEEYELPKLLFKFLESLVPGNAERSLNLLHTVLENEPPEFVFAMLARHFKDLYWVKKDPSNIPYPSWRVSKLESQASKFSIKQLKSFISKLAKTDVEVKTGKNDLLRSLDLLVMSELE
jgi:DNA polymerase III delta subunit